jgi:protocatechuate 3,4-dioxygenase beta subunit
VSGTLSASAAGTRVELLPLLPAYEQARRALDGAAEPAPAAKAETDAAGRFTLQAPGPGLWRVIVRRPEPIELAPLPLVAPAELPPFPGSGWAAVSAPPAALSTPAEGKWQDVRLTERTGEPVAGALVEVADRPFGRTDTQGRIRLPVAAGGAARLRLLSADGRQASLLLKAPPPGAPERPLTLAEPLVLAGRVIDAESRAPVPGALVWASADPGAFVRADGEGRFRLTLPTRRRPELEIAAAGFLSRKAALSGAQLASRRGSTFALARAAGLRGKVVDPQGRPLPGAAVVAVAERALGERAFAPSDPVTERALSGPQGQFELRLLHPGQGYEVRASRPGAFPAAGRVTAGDPAAQPCALTLVLAPARPVRGKVQDPAGRPIADAEVVLRPALRPGLSPAPGADAEGTTARSDAKGLFAVAEAPAAEIELAARKKGYAPALLPALRIPAGQGPAGQGSADLGIVVLRPGARLAGRVLDPRGKAIADAGIFLLPQALDVNQAERALERRKPATTTAADGAFALEDLIPGVPVHLAIRAAGFLTLQRAVRPPNPPRRSCSASSPPPS